MAIDNLHPSYAESLLDWEKMRDVYKGERYVKSRGPKYLPPTKGMILDGYGTPQTNGLVNVGMETYNAYVLRAVLPEYLQDAVELLMGLLHSQPPKIELPDALEPMRTKATPQGETLEQLLKRINEEQLVVGRVGLLLDLPSRPDPAKPIPYVALYVAEAIINWDDNQIDQQDTKLNMVVLNESGYRRDVGSFEWNYLTKYRVLELEAPVGDGGPWGAYRQGVFDGDNGADYVASDMASPTLRGVTLDDIPFAFVNTKDVVPSPDKPSLLSLADAVLTIYRGEADYRQNLFMQGQDTLVIKGELKKSGDINELPAAGNDGPLRTGTGAMIHLQGGADNDAKYIGVSGTGLPEQRQGLQNDRKRAEGKSAALSPGSGDQAESGEALKTRVSSRTASLNTIANTAATALEWILKKAAVWVGADPDKVKVTPNLEFADFQMTGDNLVKLMAAKAAGAPLSRESIHALMAEGGITKISYEQEQEILNREREEDAANDVPPGTTAGGNPADDQNAPPAAES